jgi:hypothetical protein
MVELPCTIPDTIPEARPTVATEVLLLLQVPVPPSLKEVVEPAHTSAFPFMLPGDVFTVNVALAAHPVLNT